VGMDVAAYQDMVEEATNYLHVLVALILVMYHDYALSHACFAYTFIVSNM
jgi:hypothetical protein